MVPDSEEKVPICRQMGLTAGLWRIEFCAKEKKPPLKVNGMAREWQNVDESIKYAMWLQEKWEIWLKMQLSARLWRTLRIRLQDLNINDTAL